MRSHINIVGNSQTFTYLIDYINDAEQTAHHNLSYYKDTQCIWLFDEDAEYYRNGNLWTKIDSLPKINAYIPCSFDSAKIRLYFPIHCIDTYYRNCCYALTASTYINGRKIYLGNKIFKRNDSLCNRTGVIKDGNNEYYEYIDMDIIDPYEVIYSDKWLNFRQFMCKEPTGVNNTGSILYVTLYVLEDDTNAVGNYIMHSEAIGGNNCFNISTSEYEYLTLDIKTDLNIPGWCLKTSMNTEYDDLMEYINETYGLTHIVKENITYELVIKNKDTIILGPKVQFDTLHQHITVDDINSATNEYSGIKDFFSSWNNFSEGWNLVACLSIYDPTIDEFVLNIVSNELPITQEVFKFFVNNESTIHINEDMNIIDYTLVNKIENTIVQIERPNESKSNIIQPVFFRVKETETLTIHPAVTENICINLDDYKSKVESFTLQLEGCTFKQIGTNNFGIIFKVIGSNLPKETTSGLYYILNENNELVTTGKYKYVE